MTRRTWLPHPAQTIAAPAPCPTGPRYATRGHALNALTHGLGPHRLTAAACQLGCGGWHNVPAEPPPPAGDCEPAWTTPATRTHDTVPLEGDHL